MKRIKDNIIQICKMTEDELKVFLAQFIKNNYEHFVIKPDYMIAEGDLPICLVAHMDTVFKLSPIEFFYDSEQSVLWSPDGLGADDRAGIYAILEIVLKYKLKPHIIFTTEEEKGGLGAKELIKDFPESPFKELNFLIELDRQGDLECVFYNCVNKDFSRFIKRYGFDLELGTFTDISIIAPEWKVAAVNISVGYCNEHSFSEYLNLKSLSSTILKIVRILKTKNLLCYEYIPKKYDLKYHYPYRRCAACDKHLKEFEGVCIPGMSLKESLKLCKECYSNFYE